MPASTSMNTHREETDALQTTASSRQVSPPTVRSSSHPHNGTLSRPTNMSTTTITPTHSSNTCTKACPHGSALSWKAWLALLLAQGLHGVRVV